MLLYSFRIAILIATAFVYALFDQFNNRNVPNSVAYSSVIIGVAMTLSYSMQTTLYSLLIALFIAGIAYFLYRIGQLGAGDGYEFVALSLMLPIQPSALYTGINQLGLPFILSVFIATGIVSIVFVPIYYLVIMKKKTKIEAQKKNIAKASLIFLSYLVLSFAITYMIGFKIVAIILLLGIGLASSIVFLYEHAINVKMVSFVYPKELEEGDIISVNLMSKKESDYFSRKTKLFGRLATKELIEKIKNIRKKIPVYKHAVPLAVPTLFATIISLLFGNILLFMLF